MKKTEFITFRTDQRTKEFLVDVATEKKWSISLLVEEIIKDFVHSYPIAHNKEEERDGAEEL